jgi:hypothetical protein
MVLYSIFKKRKAPVVIRKTTEASNLNMCSSTSPRQGLHPTIFLFIVKQKKALAEQFNTRAS